MEETEEKGQKPKETILTRGPRLPLGIMHAGDLHTDLAVRKWRMKEERVLGELRDEHKDANLAVYVSMVLATMCSRLGPHDFDKLSFDEKRLAVSQMFLGDVFYAYVWLRIKSLGPEFKINFTPNWSNKSLSIVADLNSVEVNSAESVKAATWVYQLKDPIEIRGQLVSKFFMGPVRWATLENIEALGQQANAGLIKDAMLQASVIGWQGDGEPIHGHLASADLDELTKYDIEMATNGVDEHNLGPLMRVEGKHKGRNFVARIDWGYDSFFAISST